MDWDRGKQKNLGLKRNLDHVYTLFCILARDINNFCCAYLIKDLFRDELSDKPKSSCCCRVDVDSGTPLCGRSRVLRFLHTQHSHVLALLNHTLHLLFPYHFHHGQQY